MRGQTSGLKNNRRRRTAPLQGEYQRRFAPLFGDQVFLPKKHASQTGECKKGKACTWSGSKYLADEA